MPTPTFIPIAKAVFSVAGSTITFSNIPQTYKDLCILFSCKSSLTSGQVDYYAPIFNSDTTGANYGATFQYPSSSSLTTGTYGGISGFGGGIPGLINNEFSGGSAQFGNDIIYIPSYSSAINHPMSFHSVQPANTNNSPTQYSYQWVEAWNWNNAAAITNITITCGANFMAGSRADLYGINGA